MNEEFLKKKQEKLGIPLEELKAQWAEFEEAGKAMGFEATALEEHVRFRINKYYLKLEREPIVEGKFQPLSVDKTDYGVMRQYQKAIEAFNTDSEMAIKDGLCTSSGVPLQQNGFNKGKIIDIETAFTVVYDGYLVLKDKEEKQHTKFRLGGKDVGAYNFELGNIYEIKGIKAQKAQKDGSILIIGKTEYVPKLVHERTYDEVREDLAEFFEGQLVAIKAIPEYCAKCNEAGDKYPIAVVKGNIYNLNVIGDKQEGDITIERNNRIELMVEDADYEIHTIGGWVPKIEELDFKFSENSQNVIIVGTVRARKDKNNNDEMITEFSKITGIFVPKEFKKDGTEEPVENTEEVTDQEIKNFVENDKPLI